MAEEQTVAAGQARTETGPFALFETVLSPMFVYQGGQMLFANAAMERLTGRSRSELAASPYCEMAHEDDKAVLRQFCEATLCGQARSNTLEFRVAARDGEVRLVALKLSPVRLKGQATLVGSVRDITDRIRAEAAQHRAQKQLSEVVDGSPVPTFVIDASHTVTHWNRACAVVTGVPASEILGTHQQWAPFYPSARPVLADLIVSGAIEEQLNAHYLAKLRRSPVIEGAFEAEDFFPHLGDGGCWLYFTAAPLYDDDDRLCGAIETLQDVTARRQAENRLREYQAQLETLVEQRTSQLDSANRRLLQSEKLASLGQLAAGVAHEINNPIGFAYSNLGSLATYVTDLLTVVEAHDAAELELAVREQMAKSGKPCPTIDIEFLKEDIPLLIDETREGLMRVKRIVQDLKEFSHRDAVSEWQWADLHKGLDATIDMVRANSQNTVEIVKEYGELPEVECLPWQLNQVFMNLLVNAAHATRHKQGTITVRTGTHGDEVWLEVADNGCGIPDACLAKVFDPFFTTKPVGTGTGMGLSMSYGIIQMHAGRIELESKEGEGTTFRVILPVKHLDASG
jgi:two-component system NtrC family sensor kinase